MCKPVKLVIIPVASSECPSFGKGLTDRKRGAIMAFLQKFVVLGARAIHKKCIKRIANVTDSEILMCLDLLIAAGFHDYKPLLNEIEESLEIIWRSNNITLCVSDGVSAHTFVFGPQGMISWERRTYERIDLYVRV
jgi:hypothetical protein